MTRYQLECKNGHGFDGWFRSSADYDAQAKKARIACPECDSSAVSKALMAPSVRTGRKAAAPAGAHSVPAGDEAKERRQFFRQLRAHVEKTFENVGERFPEEARKIHYGESEERRIYGDATGEEARALIEEGIAVAPLPAPDSAN